MADVRIRDLVFRGVVAPLPKVFVPLRCVPMAAVVRHRTCRLRSRLLSRASTYVLAGATTVLVHNTGSACGPRFVADEGGKIADLMSDITRVGMPRLEGGPYSKSAAGYGATATRQV